MDMYTLLYLKWIISKDLLYSTRNSSQCYVAAWMGRETGGEWIYAYAWMSSITTLLIGYESESVISNSFQAHGL